MAETIDPKLGHNSGARSEAIGDALKRIFDLDRRIEAIIADEIQDLRDDKTKIKKELREAHNITARVFQARYAAYKLEQQAIEADDDVMKMTLKELFDIAPVGATADMMEAVTQAEVTEQAAQ